jgi:hypothetical protein
MNLLQEYLRRWRAAALAKLAHLQARWSAQYDPDSDLEHLQSLEAFL